MSSSTLSTFEFIQKFPDNESARVFLEDKHWSGNPICPHCNSDKITIRGGNRLGYFKCRSCTKEFTVRTGTIFERSHVPLHKWLYAIYLVMIARKGISSLQLAKEIGVTQKTAWFMLQRIREACDDFGDMLSGIVEIDETYIGGKEKNKHSKKRTKGTQGRSTKTKTAIVGLRSRSGKVKASSMNRINTKTMQTRLDQHITRGSMISTDEATYYKKIRGYHHAMVNHSVGEFVNGMASTNGIESVWAVLKRGFNGTYHHFSKKHTDRYVNEFAFRLYEGNVKLHMMDRIDNFCNATFNARITYRDLVAE